jgi:probable rRNA maturation factor
VSLLVDVATDGTRSPLGRDRIARVVRTVLEREGVRDALISVAIVSRRAIAAMNRRHLGHSGPTDVIAFGLRGSAMTVPVIGDIYIAPDVARERAAAHGVGVREELARLAVHGTLHVLGYEHPDDEDRAESEMWRRQEELLATVLRPERPK